MKNLAIVNTTAPFGNVNYRESLDMALANASYDRPIALFFSGDGVFQIVANTDGTLCGQKELGKNFGLLELYDIEDVYFCQQSLAARGLSSDDLIIDGTSLAEPQWFNQLSQFDQVLTF